MRFFKWTFIWSITIKYSLSTIELLGVVQTKKEHILKFDDNIQYFHLRAIAKLVGVKQKQQITIILIIGMLAKKLK